MMPQSDSTPMPVKQERLYAIEFLRIWFILTILVGHILVKSPYKLYLFGVPLSGYAYGVEYFFLVGGFFLYRRISREYDAAALIGKTWLRLVPGLLFAFLLCAAIGHVDFSKFPVILSLLGGTALQSTCLGYGDWFIGAYFWASCLYIGLFKAPRWAAFTTLCVMIYIILCVRGNIPRPPDKPIKMEVYGGIVGFHFCRAILWMGVGLVSGFLAERVRLPKQWLPRLLATAFEGYALFRLFHCSVNPPRNHLSQVELMVLMVFFLISVSQSWGLISRALNAVRHIHLISRYVFPTLMGHIVTMSFCHKYKFFGLGRGIECLLLTLGIAIVLGVAEYHLVERRLVPWLSRRGSSPT